MFLMTALLWLGPIRVPAQTESDASNERVRVLRSVDVFRDLLLLPEKGIPPALLRQAQAIAIIPGYVKAAYVVGGEHGRGVIAVRRDDGSWSAPAFIEMTGGSLGFQIGFEKADFILVFKDKRGVETIDQATFDLRIEYSDNSLDRPYEDAVGGMNYLQIHYRELQPRLTRRDVPLDALLGAQEEGRQVWTRGIKSAANYCIKEAAKPANAGRSTLEICREFLQHYVLQGEEEYSAEQLHRNCRREQVSEMLVGDP